jgi:hypothetical protein
MSRGLHPGGDRPAGPRRSRRACRAIWQTRLERGDHVRRLGTDGGRECQPDRPDLDAPSRSRRGPPRGKLHSDRRCPRVPVCRAGHASGQASQLGCRCPCRGRRQSWNGASRCPCSRPPVANHDTCRCAASRGAAHVDTGRTRRRGRHRGRGRFREPCGRRILVGSSVACSHYPAGDGNGD